MKALVITLSRACGLGRPFGWAVINQRTTAFKHLEAERIVPGFVPILGFMAAFVCLLPFFLLCIFSHFYFPWVFFSFLDLF